MHLRISANNRKILLIRRLVLPRREFRTMPVGIKSCEHDPIFNGPVCNSLPAEEKQLPRGRWDSNSLHTERYAYKSNNTEENSSIWRCLHRWKQILQSGCLWVVRCSGLYSAHSNCGGIPHAFLKFLLEWYTRSQHIIPQVPSWVTYKVSTYQVLLLVVVAHELKAQRVGWKHTCFVY